LDRVDDVPGARALEDGERETADREDLVRAERRVAGAWPVVDVDDVVEGPRRLVPEAALERRTTLRVDVGPALREVATDPERVQPERLDLDRLPDPRRDDPVAHPRVHPGELHAGLAGGQEAVVVGTDAEARATGVPREDRVDRRLEGAPVARGQARGECEEVV